MLPTGAFALAVGVLCFVLIALVSMRGPRSRRRRIRDGGPILPLHYDDAGGDDGGAADG